MQHPASPASGRVQFGLDGWVRGYVDGVIRQWLLPAPQSNPAMLEMLRDRERFPRRDLVPWAGEFAGKHLTAAVQVYRLTGDEELRRAIEGFAADLAKLQALNGYLGPWAAEFELIGRSPNAAHGGSTWDAWGHYHVMMGFLLWHETSGDAASLAAARRIADLICAKFSVNRLVDTGSTEMNLAPIHALAVLHRRTGEARYLRMAERIMAEFGATDAAGKPMAGDFLEGTLAGKKFHELPMARWETLHCVMGMAELAAINGDARIADAVQAIWWSIVEGDRHNNGGFSSGEKACGNPYDPAAIETCCTIAWVALSVEVLRLTDASVVADELELSTLNSVTGLHSPNGRWVTYNTPMDGVRKASAQDIVFQAREGSNELNCCSVNGARGFGLISDWALTVAERVVTLNWYGPGTISAALADGQEFKLTQKTDYPRAASVRLEIATTSPETVTLRLRIPYWSRRTTVALNGAAVTGAKAGSYLVLERPWIKGDAIEIEFDFALQFWVGERECEGKVSIYRGPLLLTYDRRFNAADPDQVPALAAPGLVGRLVESDSWMPPYLLMVFPAVDGTTVHLCDFGSAGTGGTPYRSWLEVRGCTPTPFSRENPRRSMPVR